MIRRELSNKLEKSAKKFPIVTVTGPRQSGKTTLVRSVFKGYEYTSLELPDQRSFALEDPRGFLQQFRRPVILDEVQRTPELFSYIQYFADESGVNGRYILTGSQNFLLLQSISQSLAGRCAIFHLLPFSSAELSGKRPLQVEKLGNYLPVNRDRKNSESLMKMLHTGFYPRIHDQKIKAQDWLTGYYQTYLERDVRNVLNIGDVEVFNRFVRLCAARNGQLLNLSSLSADCGISHSTARRWLSVLEASFIITLLRPHYRNFGKRLTKSPKIYFLDTGLLCYLLRIKDHDDLVHHSLRGAIFESYVISEFHKYFLNKGEEPPLYFWRDSAGHEIDIICEIGGDLLPIEIKSGQTVASDFFKNIAYWKGLYKKSEASALIYGGEKAFKRHGVHVYPWHVL